MNHVIYVLFVWIFYTNSMFGPVVCVQYRSCDCSCSNLDAAVENDPVLQETLKELKKNLTIDAKSTNAHARTLISVEDPRPSAQAAGYVGIVLLVLVGGIMVLVDLTKVVAYFSDRNKPDQADGSLASLNEFTAE